MASLIDRLFPVPSYRRTPTALLRWWETRRWFYNKAVGSAGLVTLTGMLLLQSPRDGFVGFAVIVPVLAYGVAANVCYSFGWLAELLATALWGRDAPDMGPLLFREGLVFSVGLTLFPLVVTVLLTIARLLHGLLT